MTSYRVRNPRTGLPDHDFEAPTAEALLGLTRRLRNAQGAWAAGGVAARCATLQRFRAALDRERESLVETLTVDTGRRAESELELESVLGAIDRWCALAPELTTPAPARGASLPGIELSQHLHPLPLVGVISPWNFPLLLAFVDTIPALLAGCAVILKPSEVTPRWITPLERAIDATPGLAAVLGVVRGGADTGRSLTEQVDGICFTGSTATGREVAAAAARRLIPAFLELGGKDAAVVTDDVDPDRTAAALTWGSMVNAGQSCLSLERAYLATPVAAALEDRLVARVRALRLNVDGPDSGEIGPVIRAEQAEVIAGQLADARARGARVLCGGELLEHGGTWCRPTILADCTPAMRIMREETFGPVLALARVADDEQAVAAANASPYGLSGAVFCRERARARALAARLRCGAVSINDGALTALVHEGEKDAFGASGLGGSRMGPASLRRFLRRQLLLECTHDQYEPWWFSSSETGAPA